MLLLTALLAVVATEERIELLLADGARQAVREIAFVAGGAASVTRLDGTVVPLALSEVVALDLGRGPTRDPSSQMTLLLHDGSRLVGHVSGGDDEGVRFELAVGGTLDFPLDAVQALFAGPRHAELEAARFAATDGGDRLQRRTEVGGDATRGTLVRFGPESVRFEFSQGTRDFAWSDLEAVVLEAQVDVEPLAGESVEVDLVPDGTLRGALVRVSGSDVVLRLAGAKGETALPRSAVTGLRLGNERAVGLSSLEPTQVRELPWLGASADFLFAWRRDRTVTGKPLLVRGQRFGRGIGCHSRSELTFPVPAGTRRFVSFVGLSDEVLALPDRGAAEFRVQVDGKEAWKSGVVRGGDAAVALPAIDVAAAKAVTLVVDFGPGEDVADRAVWGEPFFLR